MLILFGDFVHILSWRKNKSIFFVEGGFFVRFIYMVKSKTRGGEEGSVQGVPPVTVETPVVKPAEPYV